MKKRNVWIWVVGGLALLICGSVAWPLVANATGPKQATFKIEKVYSQAVEVKDAFEISVMTREFVVPEGGFQGGILSQQYAIDMKAVIRELEGYDPESTSVIWVYQVRPLVVTRRNDLFGQDTVTITGTSTKEPKVYFAVVPKQIVKPSLQWVYVQTE